MARDVYARAGWRQFDMGAAVPTCDPAVLERVVFSVLSTDCSGDALCRRPFDRFQDLGDVQKFNPVDQLDRQPLNAT